MAAELIISGVGKLTAKFDRKGLFYDSNRRRPTEAALLHPRFQIPPPLPFGRD